MKVWIPKDTVININGIENCCLIGDAEVDLPFETEEQLVENLHIARLLPFVDLLCKTEFGANGKRLPTIKVIVAGETRPTVTKKKKSK